MTQPIRPVDVSLFDESTPASEDFYRHVNGGWLDANPVPPEYGSWGAIHEVNEHNQQLLHRLLDEAASAGEDAALARRKAGDYFAAAMDETQVTASGATPLRPLLDRIDALESVAQLPDLLRELQHIGVSALHSMGVSPDFEDSDAYLVYLGQGGLGLPERDYYLRTDEQSVTLRQAYVAHVARQMGNLGASEAATAPIAQKILAFETRLAEASYPAEKLRDVLLTLNRKDVSALDELMPAFGLTTYAQSLGVTSPTVSVDNPGFFSALDIVLAETDVETLRDYLRWHLTRAFASSLSPEFENEAFDFYGRILSGQQKLRPRWKRMLDAATADIGELVAQLYVDAAFPESAKERCEELVDHLLSSMGTTIRGAEWMGEATKAEALEKLAGFGYKIGFPDEWRDYSALVITRGPHVENRMRAAAFEYDRQMDRLGKPVDKTEWEMPAHMVNAYFHPLLNEVVFPAGILQPPFFFAEADDAVNFGAIGSVIGHEITHGFDDQGSRFDANGGLREWWTESDRAEFDKRARVLVEQFDAYEVAEGAHVNGRLTLGENIADLGGVKVALNALREVVGDDQPEIEGFTPEQRFFISYATAWRMNHTEEYLRLIVNIDPHSPARFRVNGPLANLPSFACAFGVPDGSPMLRPKESRAHVW